MCETDEKNLSYWKLYICLSICWSWCNFGKKLNCLLPKKWQFKLLETDNSFYIGKIFIRDIYQREYWWVWYEIRRWLLCIFLKKIRIIHFFSARMYTLYYLRQLGNLSHVITFFADTARHFGIGCSFNEFSKFPRNLTLVFATVYQSCNKFLNKEQPYQYTSIRLWTDQVWFDCFSNAADKFVGKFFCPWALKSSLQSFSGFICHSSFICGLMRSSTLSSPRAI